MLTKSYFYTKFLTLLNNFNISHNSPIWGSSICKCILERHVKGPWVCTDCGLCKSALAITNDARENHANLAPDMAMRCQTMLYENPWPFSRYAANTLQVWKEPISNGACFSMDNSNHAPHTHTQLNTQTMCVHCTLELHHEIGFVLHNPENSFIQKQIKNVK